MAKIQEVVSQMNYVESHIKAQLPEHNIIQMVYNEAQRRVKKLNVKASHDIKYSIMSD